MGSGRRHGQTWRDKGLIDKAHKGEWFLRQDEQSSVLRLNLLSVGTFFQKERREMGPFEFKMLEERIVGSHMAYMVSILLKRMALNYMANINLLWSKNGIKR